MSKEKFYKSITPGFDSCSSVIVLFILLGLMFKACNLGNVTIKFTDETESTTYQGD